MHWIGKLFCKVPKKNGAVDEEFTAPGSSLNSDLLAIVFTDLVGSSKLKDTHGDKFASEMEHQHQELLLEALDCVQRSSAATAQMVRVEGDSYIFVFRLHRDAVLFALQAQKLHRDARVDYPHLPEFRVGVHSGEVVIEKGFTEHNRNRIIDIRGLAADMTARIMSLAKGGQSHFPKAKGQR